MTAGRPRKPTAIRELEGNPGKRALPKNEPKPRVALPGAPKSLSPVARDEWKRVAEILYRVRVLTAADLAVLRGYCVNFAWAYEAEQAVTDTSVVVKALGHRGVPITKENPAFNAGQKAYKQMLEFARELGLTPASRSKIQSAPEEVHGPLDRLRNRLTGIKGGKS